MPNRRPPVEITPAQFFTSWLPAELSRLGTVAAMPDALVRFSLEGDPALAGAWDLVVAGGTLQADAAQPDRAPLVNIGMTVQDWRAFVVGEPGPVDLAPPAASPTDLLFVDTASTQLLENISGTFLFEVRDYNGRNWQLRATFGAQPEQDPPHAVIAIEAALYGAILAREKSAAEAYFTGGITLEGDVEKGMQVGLALMPKF